MCARLIKRRCNDPEHENSEWIRHNPELEKLYPGGVFEADLKEERAACNYLPMPKYYSSPGFLGLCPYHRAKKWPNRFPTIAEWIEVYMWMFKASAGLQGLDLGRVKAAGLSPAKYDHPLSWQPPGAVFEYWKNIGWRAPERIEEMWQRETPEMWAEYERIWKGLKKERA